MLESIRNIFSIPDLRKRIIFTLALLAVYRVGAQIPNPGISATALAEFWQAQKGTILGFVDLFSGNNMSRMTIFALGIMPYISASIILQLLQVVWPYLERLSKEGELGRKKITQYTRYGTLIICVIQAFGISLFLERLTSPGGAQIVPSSYSDYRNSFYHVVRGADFRERYWQWYFPNHFCWNCCWITKGDK